MAGKSKHAPGGMPGAAAGSGDKMKSLERRMIRAGEDVHGEGCCRHHIYVCEELSSIQLLSSS